MRRMILLAAPALFLLAGSASAETCQAMLNAMADAGATRAAPASAPVAAATAATAENPGGESGTETTEIPEGVATSVMPGADASAENDVENPAAASAPTTEAAQAEEAVEAVSPEAAEDAGARLTLLQAQAQTALDAGDEEGCLAKAREAAALAGQ